MTRAYKHLDEAFEGALGVLRRWLQTVDMNARAVLSGDLFGRLRVIVWSQAVDHEALEASLGTSLEAEAGSWWSGDLWMAESGEAEASLHAMAWAEARPDEELPDRLRLLERHRNRGAWFIETRAPLWRARGDVEPEGPPIIVFYSFKGGLGRSTALASFAIQRARLGERVAVVDFDLDAPGVGVLLAADDKGTISPWGVVDYLLEQPAAGPLSDYYHPCRRPDVVGEGELLVFPAGRLNEKYSGKLARIDFEPSRGDAVVHGVQQLVSAIQRDLAPDWILLDARTGLSESAGALLSGLGHLHVLFGTTSEQSWLGLRVAIERLGPRGEKRDLPQADCVLVQALVPAPADAAKLARASFETRAFDEFSDRYYADSSADDDRFWDLRDLDTEDAPHVPVPISYHPSLSHFPDVSAVAELLATNPEHVRLAERVTSRFEVSEDE